MLMLVAASERRSFVKTFFDLKRKRITDPIDYACYVMAADGTKVPVTTRVPLKFGSETLSHVTCARVRLEVESPGGARAVGWGETPLSVQWVWPSKLAWLRKKRLLSNSMILPHRKHAMCR